MDGVDTEVREGVDRETIETVQAMSGSYKHGWETDVEMDYAPKGLSEDIVRLISAKNEEPQWMLDWRMTAYRRWVKMEEPTWAMVSYPTIDYQD
ncbi:MAG: Fe-S cluster assembly protein SufB, partial [Paracoccaceae bacterium]